MLATCAITAGFIKFFLTARFGTHFRYLLRVDDAKAREWYLQEAAQEQWSARTLDRNISSQYYERLLLSQRKEPVQQEMQKKTADLQQDKLEFIKNPVVAEFLGLAPNQDFTENELEGSIIMHLSACFTGTYPRLTPYCG